MDILSPLVVENRMEPEDGFVLILGLQVLQVLSTPGKTIPFSFSLVGSYLFPTFLTP